jgi:hypothetical protein
MLSVITPHALLRQQVGILRQQIPSILNGDADGVHDARIATRRIRELLPRIAIKKFRYILEIGQETGTLRAAEAIRDLKKAQDMLGDLHDRQALIDEIGAARPSGDDAMRDEQIGLVTQVVEAEIRDLHARYLCRRARVLVIADGREPPRHAFPASPLVVAAGALAVSSGPAAATREVTHRLHAHDRRHLRRGRPAPGAAVQRNGPAGDPGRAVG